MPGDYDGNTNQFKNNSVIPPELQSIIDKVSGMSMSVGRKAGLLADLGGQVGGLERQRMSDTSSMARLGVEQESVNKRFDTTQKLEQDKFGLEKEKVGNTQKAISPYLQGQITSGFGMGSQPEQPKEKYPGYSNLLKIW